jgi:heptosyltransferase I
LAGQRYRARRSREKIDALADDLVDDQDMSEPVRAKVWDGGRTVRTPAKRVLIVRIGAMGDVLHAMPAVAALRALQPDWFIGWAIEPRWSELLQISGDFNDMSQGVGHFAPRAMVDRWYRVQTDTWKRRTISGETVSDILGLREVLREDRFDVCVDMQGALKSALAGRLAGAKEFVGPAEPRERIARWWYKQEVAATADHVVEQGCELLGAAVGETLRPAKVTLPMDEGDELWADKAARGERFVLIAPTAGWGAKVWPAERYGEVAAALARAGFRVLVNAAGPGPDPFTGAGQGVAERVVEASGASATAIHCSIGQLISLVRRAAVVIAGDSGPLHLAAALERPVVGIYGPTDPARNGPWVSDTGAARVLRDEGSVTSHKRGKEPEAGMLRISAGQVVAAALELLRGV